MCIFAAKKRQDMILSDLQKELAHSSKIHCVTGAWDHNNAINIATGNLSEKKLMMTK